MVSKTQTSASQPLPDSELVTDPARVARLLERLAHQHALLTVQIPGHRECFTSSIVAVDRPYVLLDELMPTTGHPLLVAERRLTITGKLDGIDVRFVTTLERVEEEAGVITYLASLPGRLEYRQRRSNYRVHIPMARRQRVIIERSDATVLKGELHDLSLGGAGILFSDVTPDLVRGQSYECAIELSNAAWLYCAIVSCYSKTIPPHDRQLVGTRFVKLTPAQARLLGQCISDLEREFIRKRAAD